MPGFFSGAGQVFQKWLPTATTTTTTITSQRTATTTTTTPVATTTKTTSTTCSPSCESQEVSAVFAANEIENKLGDFLEHFTFTHTAGQCEERGRRSE